MTSDRSKREVTRRVRTPLNEIAQDAAIAVNINPHESEVVGADVTADGELQLTIEGSEI